LILEFEAKPVLPPPLIIFYIIGYIFYRFFAYITGVFKNSKTTKNSFDFGEAVLKINIANKFDSLSKSNLKTYLHPLMLEKKIAKRVIIEVKNENFTKFDNRKEANPRDRREK
jgi:hypothetical protein